MLRVIKFEGEKAQEKFDKVWEGFLFGTRAESSRRQGQAPDVAKQRQRARMTKKLKAISTESKKVIVGSVMSRDVVKDAVLELEQNDLELLIKTMEEAEWNPEHLDDAFDTIDWLSASEKKET